MASNLVSEGERHSPTEGLHERRRSERHADVGVAQPISSDLHKHFTGPGNRHRSFGQFGRVFPFDDAVGLHHFGHLVILT